MGGAKFSLFFGVVFTIKIRLSARFWVFLVDY